MVYFELDVTPDDILVTTCTLEINSCKKMGCNILSLMVALIYSGAVLITFIFVVMTFDQSDILCIPSYKFIPLLVLYIEGFIP